MEKKDEGWRRKMKGGEGKLRAEKEDEGWRSKIKGGKGK